jgi:hypothetical protein
MKEGEGRRWRRGRRRGVGDGVEEERRRRLRRRPKMG